MARRAAAPACAGVAAAVTALAFAACAAAAAASPLRDRAGRGGSGRGAAGTFVAAPTPAPIPVTTAVTHTGSVFPFATGTADSAPVGANITSPRSECGVGAMMAWNDLLYFVTYLSVPNAGAGTGLYSVDQNLVVAKLADHSSVYANRLLHAPSNRIIIGPYIIDAAGNIATITGLLQVRPLHDRGDCVAARAYLREGPRPRYRRPRRRCASAAWRSTWWTRPTRCTC